MTRYEEAERFAARLRVLRERANYSYEALSQKTGISRSSLHRYCAGSSVPQDYGAAHRIATVCGATPAELRELHRLWALSDTERGQRVLSEEARETRETRETRDAEETREAGKGDEGGGEGLAAEALGTSAAREPETAAGEPETAAGATETAAGERGTAARERETAAGEPGTAAGAPETVAGEPEPEGTPQETGSPSQPGLPTARGRLLRPWGRRLTAVTVAVAVVVLGIAAWWVSTVVSHTKEAEADDQRVLFSSACRPVIGMGQQDECVREAQLLLRRRGASIGVDGIFGPETLRRVTAFQVFAGITPNGVVADPTKKALYESKVRIDTWSPEKVRERIREVFTEAPDDAVAIADCQSFLDPLHILPNTNGTRNWGLFQISDTRLRELGGTPRQALDPEWNIQAAKRLWSSDRDFHDWPHCERALRTTPTPSAS